MPRTTKTADPPRRWYRGADVPMRVIRRYARAVAERFQPDKIILFGSHAYGTPHADSDVDLLVVMPCRNEIDQAIKIRTQVAAPFPMDLIVRKPKDLAWRLAAGDWFLREIVESGKNVYCPTGAGSKSESVSPKPNRRPASEFLRSALTLEWVRKAENDWEYVRLGSDHRQSSLISFYSRQCSEKYLKAVLQETGRRVPRATQPDDLLSPLSEVHPSILRLGRGVHFLSRFTIDVLYPGTTTTNRQAEAAHRWAGRIRGACRDLLGIKPKAP